MLYRVSHNLCYFSNCSDDHGSHYATFKNTIIPIDKPPALKFLKEAAVDTALLYDSVPTGVYPTGSMAFSNIGQDGDAANGDAMYATSCAGCHGADGTSMLVDGSYSVGSFVRGKPNEAQHKFKFGQLGTGMGSLVTDLADLKDIYKALTDAGNYPDPT